MLVRTIYISEMHQLPPEVQEEFDKGNYAVKRTGLPFNECELHSCLWWFYSWGEGVVLNK